MGSVSLHTGLVLAGLSKERMCDLGIAKQSALEIAANWQKGGAHRDGVVLFERFHRFCLTMQMRTDDEVHKAYLDAMRDTTSEYPIKREWVRSLKAWTRADVAEDPAWRFAEVATPSNLERVQINNVQVRAFAKFHGLPLIKWKKKIDAADQKQQSLSSAELDEMYLHEPNLVGCFVKGCPRNISVNIATSRGIVNGMRAYDDSLTLPVGSRTLEERLAAMRPGETELWLDEPPLTINVVPDLPADEMAVLLAANLSLCTDRVVIPVPKHSRASQCKLHSVHAAMYGLPPTVKIIDHQCDIGFAGTDFKMQSKTKTKLVISLGRRRFPPWFVLSTIYVLASRVRKGYQIRVIGLDPQRDNIDHLTSLQHPAVLGIWENGYAGGNWSRAKLNAAIDAALGGTAPAALDQLDDGPDDEDAMEE